ncbi:uncharacterized protein LAESUDRAFT_697349 [Laetiporus sulphureus 93-53]|uniref:Mediator complex subunit 1 n=1 Tax=Laetiporus sulphureus 93-53 TaxID=1314785 RepID=A0A165F5A7_9APHY|nr:uncharacterized protein LAESUDRAFT_697349 [Laetiporus sulphureus 93-53]KZT08418.1 hypothetical protein LAESUDRAFT_697349 [Laetiporus sulphureus 93-53]
MNQQQYFAQDRGETSTTLLSVLHELTSRQDAFSSHSLHPFAAEPDTPVNLLHAVIDATNRISHSLSTHLSLPLADQKLISLYRQHTSIAQILHRSEQNIRSTLDSLRKREGITYGEDIPLERMMIADWCVSRLETWGSSAGMEAFREEERDGRIMVVLGGKVLVIDIELSVDRSDSDNPKVSLATLKTSYAILNGAATQQGSLSLDGFLAMRIGDFLTEVQKEADERDSVEAARLGRLFAEHMMYLMQLDQLATNEGANGLRWFSDMDALALETERFATQEAEVISRSQPSSYVPLDVFLMRSHALPLPYLTSPSMSFLVHISPRTYLFLLRSSPSSAPPSTSPVPNFDIPLSHLRSQLSVHPRPEGVTLATLTLTRSFSPISSPDSINISDLATRPTFPLVQSGHETNFSLPLPQSSEPGFVAGQAYSWILDFTDGGKYPGVVMSQSRMREIELVINPLSGTDHMNSAPMAFGMGSWLGLLLNRENPIAPERFIALYTSPTSTHPPLQYRLTSPEEPGFILEKVPVRTVKEIWGILEVVREQCWLNEIISAQHWVPEGLTGEPGEELGDDDATEDDLDALLKGTLTPRRLPVNLLLPIPPPPDLLDPTSLSPSSHTRLLLSSPERPPMPGLVEISVGFDPSRPRGVAVAVTGAMGADLQMDVLEEVCRRGGVLGLAGRVWAKSHGSV